MKVHTDSIGITFEFEGISSLIISNFEYNATKALSAYGIICFFNFLGYKYGGFPLFV